MYYSIGGLRASDRVITNSTGTVCYDSDFYPFGALRLHTNNCPQNTKYAGMEQDSETGYYHTQFRQYYTVWGRWLSPDPLGGDVTNPQSLNRYAYALNNPVNFVDPLGLCPKGDYPIDYKGKRYCGHGAPWKLVWQVLSFITINMDNEGFTYPGVGSQGGYVPVYNGDEEVNGTGAGTPSFLQVLKNKVCSALPQGRTFGVSGGIGGIGGQTGTLELVMNYDSGQVSGFASGGFQLGWNGVAQGSAFTGFIFGNLKGDNSGYSGGFTTLSGNARLGGFLSVASGGPGAPLNFRPVSVAGVNAGVSLIPTPTVTGSATNYTKPLQLGKFWGLSNPLDLALYLANQVCR